MGSNIRSRQGVILYLVIHTVVALTVAVAATAIGCLFFFHFDLSRSVRGDESLTFGVSLAAGIVLVLTPALTLRSALNYRTLNRLRDQFETLARTDPLTGLNNRRGLDEGVKGLARGRAVSALLCDLDHFKRVNDVCGHETGDAVLRATGQFLAELAAIRPRAFAARYGGEEFVIVLPETSAEEARLWAETVRARFAARAIPGPYGLLRLTISIGVAAVGAYQGDLAALISQADAALYCAKREGRNRVAAAA